jgi:transposase-like protein
VVVGRQCYERQGLGVGDRAGEEEGTLATTVGVLRVIVPQVRGISAPYHSHPWTTLAQTSGHRKTRTVEICVGGMSQRDMEAALETALGQVMLSTSSINTMTDTLSQAYEALRTRDLRGSDVVSLCMDTVYEP